MNTKRTSASICAETVPCEVIDKDGRKHGPFHGLAEANAFVQSRFPNEEQDEDRTGKGWDCQVVGCDDLQ